MTVPFQIYRPRLSSLYTATYGSAVPAPDDRAVVERLRAGDTLVFEELFRAYYGPLCGFVASYVRSLDVAEEQVQEVFWWLWEHRENTDSSLENGLRAYLYTAARHRALNCLKREEVTERWESQAAPELGFAGIGQGPPGIERVMRQREITTALASAIERLPDRRRQAFELVWQHGLAQAEAAAVMGISVKGVEAALAKAIVFLRKALAPVR
jgi:RNA polymerase sigma-70 factor (ECF subfamily)